VLPPPIPRIGDLSRLSQFVTGVADPQVMQLWIPQRLSLQAKRSNLGATVHTPGRDCFVACGASQ
jgi:hypothetical protein